jgi:hypothetical protein
VSIRTLSVHLLLSVLDVCWARDGTYVWVCIL